MAESEHSPNDGFLGRWSRRKQRDQSDTNVPVEDQEPATQAKLTVGDANITMNEELDQSDANEAVVSEEKLLTDEDMVPLESLNADSDYSPFFSEGVSKQLRNMALKKLFFSGKFAIRDGLDDYDDDFTKFEPLGDTITSDMKFHQRRKEKARLARLEEERLEEEKRKQQEAQDSLAEKVGDDSPSDEMAMESGDGIEQTESSDENAVDHESAEELADVAIASLSNQARQGMDLADPDQKSPNPKLTKMPDKSTGNEQGQLADENKRDKS